ncbi:MAG TPA: histidine kinase dimerization/phospho-acceptor domain-containing protein, partial [Chondromyces sp.]|nr:histidine kinase dimerization/phospho-acceptor domain-containing protein [Chondromyces sp.]
MILCMKFPVTLDIGFIVDLRYIPFIIVALYGGYKYAFFLYILLNVYRFYIGGEGTLPSLYFSTAIFILVPLLNKKFIQLVSHYRVLWAVSASFLTMALYLSTLRAFFEPSNQEFWLISVYAVTTYTSIMMIIVMLIEKIIANMKTHERFLHQERLSVISELSASVSHEIRNPLTVANGFLQLLSESKNLTEIERQYVDYSLQELNRAEKIVSDYLALAKPQSEN